MPQYDFKCSHCGFTTELTLQVSQRNTHPVCPECTEAMSKTFIAANWEGQMSLKGMWVSKGIKEDKYRARRGVEMSKRQRDRYGSTLPTLAPNVNGERVESWKEAKEIVASQGADTSTYDQKVKNLPGKKE